MKKLAIVGFAQGKDRAPKANAQWDVWRCNPGFLSVTEVDAFLGTSRFFEIHTRRYLTEAHGKAYVDGVTKLMGLTRAPTYFLRASEWRVKEKREFPRQRIARAFPRGDYHASSFDWMLSFAILEGYKHIELFGLDLGPTDAGEPISARPCLEYWCGVAAGRGITVVSHSANLFHLFNYQRTTTPYHYDDAWRLIEDRP